MVTSLQLQHMKVLWVLRKLKNFRSFELYDQDTPTNSVDFDHSGSYLAIAGSDVRIYQVGSVKADWNCIKTLPDLSGTGKATCVKFGSDAKYLAVGSKDRSNLLIFWPSRRRRFNGFLKRSFCSSLFDVSC